MWWLSDGFMLFFNILAFASALLFLFIVARHRTCRHLSVILVANTCCAGLIATSAGISQAISMLFGSCDYSEQCVLAAYFYMSGCGAIFHSLCLQALHRLFSNVLKTGVGNHGILWSRWFYTILIIVQWLISITYVLPVYRNIAFIPGSCLYQMSLTHIPSFFDGLFGIYAIPLFLIIIVYLIIWRFHMTHMRATARQSIAQRHRMHREVVMFKRIIIPLGILFIAGCPYLIFFFMLNSLVLQ